MSDLIERQTAIRAITNHNGVVDKSVAKRILVQLPSAQPEHSKNAPQKQPNPNMLGIKTEETCEDVISRRAAIDAVENIDCSDGVGISALKCEAVGDVVTAIKGLPSAQPERKTGKWIPCSERLPEKNGRYLVTRGLNAAGAIWNRVYIANFSDLMGLRDSRIFWQGNVGKSDFEKLEDVLAWLPLPEPWKEESDG